MNEINNIKLKRGDVYIADFRGLDCGLYGFVPAIIVQSDRVNPESSTTIVVPVFTIAEESPFCIPLKGAKLRRRSKALCDRIVCIDKYRLKNRLCRLDEEELRKVTRTLKRTLAINPSPTYTSE